MMELPTVMVRKDESDEPKVPAMDAKDGVSAGSDADAWVSDEFGRIYSEHSRAIYYLALRMLAEPAQAEDATHDIFLKAFRKLPEFRGESAMRTWLYRIAINHCQNLLQLWHRRHIFADSEGAALSGAPASSGNPLRVLELKELGQTIQATLDRLPDEYRLLLLLVADQELSYDEVAALTGQSSDAVRGKLHRARKAFAVQYQKLC